LKVDQTDLGEVVSIAAVVADQRAGVLFQAIFVWLRAAATIAILHLFAPLLDDVLVGQSLKVGIDVVSIDVHRVGIVETRGEARSQRCVVTGSACLALVVLQVSDLQIYQVAIGFECGIIFCHNREVRQPIDVIGIQSLLKTIKQILIWPAGSRGPGLKVCHKLTESALALLHSDDFVFSVGLRTDRLKLQFECCKEGVLVCKRCFAFCKRFYVELSPHSCILNYEWEGWGDHFMNVKQGSSICTLHLLALKITERKTIFVCIDPNAKDALKQSGRLWVLALEDYRLLCCGCALFFAFPCLFLASAYCHSATHIAIT
jgi:hypothetical protein